MLNPFMTIPNLAVYPFPSMIENDVNSVLGIAHLPAISSVMMGTLPVETVLERAILFFSQVLAPNLCLGAASLRASATYMKVIYTLL